MVDRIGPYKPFRHYIQEWMTKRDMNQTHVANRLECGTGTISKLLSGKMELTAGWLSAFAYALDVEVPDLFRDPAMPTQEDLLRGESPRKQAEIVRVIKAMKAG